MTTSWCLCIRMTLREKGSKTTCYYTWKRQFFKENITTLTFIVVVNWWQWQTNKCTQLLTLISKTPRKIYYAISKFHVIYLHSKVPPAHSALLFENFLNPIFGLEIHTHDVKLFCNFLHFSTLHFPQRQTNKLVLQANRAIM